MHPATRQQKDYPFDEASEAATITFEGTEDLTRQEYAEEVNVNNILKRFGIGGLRSHQDKPVFTDMNTDATLQDAIESMRDADRVHDSLPESLKAKYPTTASMLNAFATGELAENMVKAKADQDDADNRARIQKELDSDEAKERTRLAKRAQKAAERVLSGEEPPPDPKPSR